MPDQPNIIVCICDQLRAFETGCYGNPVIRTPHVDRLAEEGVRFEVAVTNYPVCMAARSVLISGQYNRTCTGGVANVQSAGDPGDCVMPEYPHAGRPHLRDTTLPEALRDLGYHNSVIGKWHIHSWPDEVGFDDYLIPRVHHCHSAQHFTENGGPEFVPEGFSVDFEAGRVESYLQGRSQSEQPFFLYYSISPPHCPVIDAPEGYRTMYSPGEVPLRPNVDLSQRLPDEDYWWRVYRHDFRYYHLHLPYTDQVPEGYGLRELIAEYYGATTWMDAAVGRMLGALDRTGLAENTVVLFTSDHGDNLGSLGLWQKGGPNEESARVPYVWRWPREWSGGQVASRPVASLVDVAPTLIELAGGTAPASMGGQSLAPVLRGEMQTLPREHAFTECGHGVAIRTPSHMCFVPRDQQTGVMAAKATQFFDLTSDPYEMNNLANCVAQPDVRAGLEDEIRAFNEQTPWLPPAKEKTDG